jgi:hypothetical protein
MKPILTLVLTLSCLTINAQTTIEFRISTVSSDIADMDGFLQGDSDPNWQAEILDGTSLSSFDEEITENCPGTKTYNQTFASRLYNCALPTNFTFRWRGFEDDGWFFGEIVEANTGWQTVNIPAAGLTATAFTTIGSYTATAGGDKCGGGSTVTWGITLQYRIVGSFLTNTAPTGINASSLIIQTGQHVTLTQVGGTTSQGSAVFNWYIGSCNGTLIGTGPSITPVVNAPTTYYVKSVGTCSTTCAAITIASSALGVTLSESYYLCSDNTIDFYWQTESENKNSHFRLEQLVSPDNWKPVAEIKGHGTTQIAHQYSYELPSSATTNDQYYRLVQVDTDGKQTVYDPFYAACNADSKTLTIYPNPNTGSWSIYPFEPNLQIRSIRNQVGKLVPFEIQEGTVQLTNPEAGTYFVELISNGQIEIQKVVVQ